MEDEQEQNQKKHVHIVSDKNSESSQGILKTDSSLVREGIAFPKEREEKNEQESPAQQVYNTDGGELE